MLIKNSGGVKNEKYTRCNTKILWRLLLGIRSCQDARAFGIAFAGRPFDRSFGCSCWAPHRCRPTQHHDDTTGRLDSTVRWKKGWTGPQNLHQPEYENKYRTMCHVKNIHLVWIYLHIPVKIWHVPPENQDRLSRNVRKKPARPPWPSILYCSIKTGLCL